MNNHLLEVVLVPVHCHVHTAIPLIRIPICACVYESHPHMHHRHMDKCVYICHVQQPFMLYMHIIESVAL